MHGLEFEVTATAAAGVVGAAGMETHTQSYS